MPHDDASDGWIDDQEELIAELLAEDAEVAGDVVEIRAGLWAIHGHIPVDGEVILAEFGSFEQASAAVDRLPPNEGTQPGEP
ncbi:MAG TPA: hypothetical protein VFI46_09490 [Jiangellaceae bacterium]|nr:hypothetical protein [Jiangellaceae bacterium]